MKVLLTADAVGGVWTYVMELAFALSSHDVQFVVAVMGPAPSPQQMKAARPLNNVELVQRDSKLEWMQEPWIDVDEAGEWLLALANDRAVDLVHLNGYTHAALPWQVPCIVVAHSCVLTWWRAVREESAPHEWKEYRRRVSTGLRRANYLVAPTHSFLAQLKREYGDLPRSAVIYNARSGCDAGARTHEETPFIFAAGRLWDQAKNIATLDVAAKNLSWPLYVAGATTLGRERQSLSYARTLGQLGATEMSQYLERAAIFASATLYEPFGLSILEAARSRCALVLSDIDTLRELWSDAAVFVPPRDAGAWHLALESLSADATRTAHLAALAYERAQRYSSRCMGAEYFSLYKRLRRTASIVALAEERV